MPVTLPIPARDLRVSPLSNAEIDAMLAAYKVAAVANVVADPVTAAFATGLQAYAGNRHVLVRDVSRAAWDPERLDVDQNGNSVPA